MSQTVGCEHVGQFSIRQRFISHLPNGDLLVQYDTGVLRVTEPRMRSWLLAVDADQRQFVTHGELQGAFAEDFDAAVEYLLSNGLLEPVRLSNFQVERVYLSISDGDLANLVQQAVSEIAPCSRMDPSDIEEYDNRHRIDESFSGLYVFFASPYNRNAAIQIRDWIRRHGRATLLFACEFEGQIYVHNLYHPCWRCPCPNCVMEHVRSGIRGSSGDDTVFRRMMDALHVTVPEIGFPFPLSGVQRLVCAALLVNRINQLVLIPDSRQVFWQEYGQVAHLDLRTLAVHTYPALHWELCDCYG
jgi:McbB family protein